MDYSILSFWFLVYFLLRIFAILDIVMVLPMPRFVKNTFVKMTSPIIYPLWFMAGGFGAAIIPVYVASIKAGKRMNEVKIQPNLSKDYATIEYFKWQRNLYMMASALILIILFIRLVQIYQTVYALEDDIYELQKHHEDVDNDSNEDDD